MNVDLVEYDFQGRRAEMLVALGAAQEAIRDCFAPNTERPADQADMVTVPAAVAAVHTALCVVQHQMDEWRRESEVIVRRSLRLPFDSRYADAYDEETATVLKIAAPPVSGDREIWGVRYHLLRHLIALHKTVGSADERLRCRAAAVSVVDEFFEKLAEPFLHVHDVFRVMLHCFTARRDSGHPYSTEP